MTKTEATPILDSKQKRFKGSLAGTLVRTLLVFTFIPFAIMAGAAYFRARTLLREQAVAQFQNLMATQVRIIDGEIKNKNDQLGSLLADDQFKRKVELGLHANPKLPEEYKKIR